MKTFLFCIGAQKAGTTWLARYLAQYDDIDFSVEKETHYFDRQSFWLRLRKVYKHAIAAIRVSFGGRSKRFRNLPRQDQARFHWLKAALYAVPTNAATYRWFKRKTCRPVRVIGDITPAYAVLSAKDYRRMARVCPDTKFLFILRDPVARQWSQVRMMLGRKGISPSLDAEQVALEVEKMIGDENSPPQLRGDYIRTIRELRKAVPETAIKIMFMEDLFGPDRAAFQKELLAFIGLPYRAFPDLPKANEGKNFVKPAGYDKRVFAHLRTQYEDLPAVLDRELPPSWHATRERLTVADKAAE